MKVGVISNQQGLGQSSFIVLLASVFSKTQMRRSVILSTGSLKSLLELVDVNERSSSTQSVNVFRALLETTTIQSTEMYDYAYRIAENEVFAFDIFSTVDKEENLNKLFLTTLKNLSPDLTLIEIVGDRNSELNEKVLANVDAILYLMTASSRSLKEVKEYRENEDALILAKTGFVCQKYDRESINEKRIAALSSISVRNLMQLPYNVNIIAKTLEGDLNSLTREIAKGGENVMNLRTKLLEIMRFLFDSDKVKYIKGVNEWYK